MMEAVLSNADHPEYGVATIPLPIPRNQYDHCVSLLEALEIGDASEADCRLDSLDSAWPVLNRLVCTKVNLDELDYKELIEAAQDTMRELIQKMEHRLCDNPVIEEQMRQLVQALETTTGKKQYGYLKKPLKALVDTIVDELARQPEVAKCYETWNQIRDELNECYGSRTPREQLPLSQQKEFRRIKNDIIREAENIRLGLPTFEDEKMQDEPEPEAAHEEQRSNSVYEQARRYRAAKTVLQDVYALDEEHAEAVRVLEQLWAEGYTVAAHQLGKFYRDDLSTMRDHEKAERWFRLSAEAGNDFSEYALGKLQSLAQLEKNYGKEGCEIIQDNCQDTIFGGGFAPNSQTAEVLSKALGSRTVLSGSVSRGKNDPSQSLQMMERALLTPDELKSIPKGSFIVMKTGTHPMRTRLQLFLNWGITFGEPYVVPERANRAVAYANRVDLERNLPQLSEPEEMDESRGYAVSSRGGIAHTPAQERAVKRGKQMKTFGEEER